MLRTHVIASISRSSQKRADKTFPRVFAIIFIITILYTFRFQTLGKVVPWDFLWITHHRDTSRVGGRSISALYRVQNRKTITATVDHYAVYRECIVGTYILRILYV